MTETVRLLYVDDEADIRDVVEMSLEDEPDFELRLCGSCAAAVDQAKTWRPDLLLLDVMMPGLDGPATLEQLRALPGMQSVAAVFVTAKVQAKEIEQLTALGAIGVIPKPFDPMTLADHIRTLWKSRHGG